MTISRRQFLLGSAGAAAGLILPSFYERALAFIESHNEPLIEATGRTTLEVNAVLDGGYGKWRLSVGDPYEIQFPEMTLREFARRYNHDAEDLLIQAGFEPDDLNALNTPVDWDDLWFFERGFNEFSPDAKAYRLFKELNLGPALNGPDPIGEIVVGNFAGPASGDVYQALAADDISLSLLQQRLNDLNTGISIRNYHL